MKARAGSSAFNANVVHPRGKVSALSEAASRRSRGSPPTEIVCQVRTGVGCRGAVSLRVGGFLEADLFDRSGAATLCLVCHQDSRRPPNARTCRQEGSQVLTMVSKTGRKPPTEGLSQAPSPNAGYGIFVFV